MSYVSVSTAAKRLDLSTKSVRRLIEAGDLATVNVAPSGSARRSIRISEQSLSAFIDRRRIAVFEFRPRQCGRAELMAFIQREAHA